MLTQPSPLPQTAVHAYVPWDMLAAIDLHDGDRARLADPDTIRRFDPERAAALAVEHFGGHATVQVLER
jgi:hypothetical protein